MFARVDTRKFVRERLWHLLHFASFARPPAWNFYTVPWNFYTVPWNFYTVPWNFYTVPWNFNGKGRCAAAVMLCVKSFGLSKKSTCVFAHMPRLAYFCV